MKIGINGRFLSTLRITGNERVANEIVSRLKPREGVEMTLFADRNRALDLKKLPLLDTRWGRKAIQRHLYEQFLFSHQVESSGVDVLFNPTFTGPLRVNRQVIMLHDVTFLPEFGWHKAAFSTYYSWLIPRLVKNGCGIITGSLYSKKQIMERLGAQESSIRVIPYGVTDNFRPVESPSVTSRYNLPDRFLLFVGSIEPRKNLRVLLQALSVLKKRKSMGDLPLVLVGCKGSNFSEAGLSEPLSAVAESVQFLGYVPDEDLPALYSLATAFIFPSLYEGFGLPVLEAMACGTPVIASDSTSLPEVVGHAGILFPPSDPVELADAITKLIQDEELRMELVQRGFHNASRFRWDKTAAATQCFLEEFPL